MIASLIGRHRFVTGAAGLVIVGALVAGAWQWHRAGQAEAVGSASFPNLEIQPLTFTGDVRFPAISPDGRFVTYVRQNAVWVRQVTAETDVQIVPPVQGRSYRSLTVMLDGNSLDFVVVEKGVPNLWRVPLLGGASRQIADNVWSAIGWSPDGRHMAFLRTTGVLQDASVIVGDADGSHERTLATRHVPLSYMTNAFQGSPSSRPSWSFDGKSLLLVGLSVTPERLETSCELATLDATTGAEIRIVPTKNRSAFGAIGAVWLDDTRLLVEVDYPSTLWSADPLAERWTPITREFASFEYVNLTADRRTAVATRTEKRMDRDASRSSIATREAP